MGEHDAILERQPGETASAYTAFLDYCEMGAERSLRSLLEWYVKRKSDGNQTGKPPTTKWNTIAAWSFRHNWQERVKVWDANELRKRQDAHDQAVKEMNDRHVKLALLHQSKAINKLNAMDGMELTPRDVLAYTELSVRLEREARGVVKPNEVNLNLGTQKQEPSLADRIVRNEKANQLAHDLLAALAGGDAPTVGTGDAGVDGVEPDARGLAAGETSAPAQ